MRDALALDRPRAPRTRPGSRMYESHYLTAWDQAGGRALWLRYTSLKRVGEPASATVWLTFFDRQLPAPTALRVSVDEPLAHPAANWLSCSLGTIGPDGAEGAISAEAGSREPARWQLSWRRREPALPYLPAMWLYDRPLPRSNGAAIVPAGTATGTLSLGAEDIVLDGWELMVGHNWGSDHADAWCWLHAGRLGENADGWLDLVLVKVGLGPLTTPWIAAGALVLDGRRYVPAPLRRVVMQEGAGQSTARVNLSPRATLAVAVMSPPDAVARWDYESPDGPGRRVTNCSVADGRIRLHGASGTRDMALEGSVAIERGQILVAPAR